MLLDFFPKTDSFQFCILQSILIYVLQILFNVSYQETNFDCNFEPGSRIDDFHLLIGVSRSAEDCIQTVTDSHPYALGLSWYNDEGQGLCYANFENKGVDTSTCNNCQTCLFPRGKTHFKLKVVS